MKDFRVTGKVEIFPMQGGWMYIRVPKKITKIFTGKMFRGLVPITAQIGKTEWKTSLLPMGDGTHFIALKAAVRKKEGIDLGDKITISFSPRQSYG